MKIGIGLPNQVRDVDPRIIPRWATKAEEAGFATLGSVGRYAYPGVMDTVALAAAAAVTNGIGLLSHILLAPVWPAHLLAKEIAGIDGVSGGRLTVGIGVGDREDDFVVPGLGLAGRGKRLDQDLRTYRQVWDGEPVGGGANPAVPSGTRRVPLLFGAMSDAAFRRGAREGDGFIGPAAPPAMVGQVFDAARAAWAAAGRAGQPRLVACSYFAFGDVDEARTRVRDYYSASGAGLANLLSASVSGGVAAVRETAKVMADLGADELMFGPALGNLDELTRLAEAVL